MLLASLLPCGWDLNWISPSLIQYWPPAEHLCLEIPAVLQSQPCKPMQVLSASLWYPHIQASSASGTLHWLFSLYPHIAMASSTSSPCPDFTFMMSPPLIILFKIATLNNTLHVVPPQYMFLEWSVCAEAGSPFIFCMCGKIYIR